MYKKFLEISNILNIDFSKLETEEIKQLKELDEDKDIFKNWYKNIKIEKLTDDYRIFVYILKFLYEYNCIPTEISRLYYLIQKLEIFPEFNFKHFNSIGEFEMSESVCGILKEDSHQEPWILLYKEIIDNTEFSVINHHLTFYDVLNNLESIYYSKINKDNGYDRIFCKKCGHVFYFNSSQIPKGEPYIVICKKCRDLIFCTKK